MPLHFASRRDSAIKEERRENRVKKEEGEEDFGEATGIAPLVAEADDEDEEDYLNPEGWRDSGIGTGLDDEARRGVERRRRALFGGDRKV